VAVGAAEVQTSSTENSAAGDVAQEIAALRGASADRGYAALVEQVGSDVKSAQDDQSNSQTMVTAGNNQRQSVSGVSLDEEMTNLITFSGDIRLQREH
jgi:flagellar hook-associated protein FlgK